MWRGFIPLWEVLVGARQVTAQFCSRILSRRCLKKKFLKDVCSYRMENSVLGNALEGVPEESSEEVDKQNDSKIESADNLDGEDF